MIDFIDTMVRSLVIGCLYSLAALGLTLSYRTVKWINFAHSEIITVGAFLGTVVTIFSQANLIIAIVIAFIGSALVCSVIYVTTFEPLTARGSKPIQLILGSIAAGMIVRYAIYIIASTSTPRLLNIKPNISVYPVYTLGNATITNLFFWIVPNTLIIFFLIHLFLKRTKIGKAFRAVASNIELAQVTGVNAHFVKLLSYFLGGGLAGIAGIFWALFSGVTPESGLLILPGCLAASILGGFNVKGTIVGGYVVGFAENAIMDVLNNLFGVDMVYKSVISCLVLLLAMFLRPTGLMTGGFKYLGLSGLGRMARFIKGALFLSTKERERNESQAKGGRTEDGI